MVDYPRAGRAEDVVRFECRFLCVKITMWALFVIELLFLIGSLLYNTSNSTVGNWLIFADRAISFALMLGALRENFVMARALFFYTLLSAAATFVYYFWIALCFMGVSTWCGYLPKEMVLPNDAPVAKIVISICLLVYICATALVLWLFWIYGSYLKAKFEHFDIEFGNKGTYKQDEIALMGLLNPSTSSAEQAKRAPYAGSNVY
ncbi:unnamed protein product, partial [Mesorhabditis belari]|uniref:Uncharacterized protein n=1 Tax=Mesorhabditis belari TaxID=2138241 RepID=A0AAF3EFB5_9BILA